MNSYIICEAVTENSRVEIPSVKKTCFKCAKMVWVSHASLKLAEKRKALYVCISCALEMDEFNEDAVVESISKEQVEEMKKYSTRFH